MYVRKWFWLQSDLDPEDKELDREGIKDRKERAMGSILLYVLKMVIIATVMVSTAKILFKQHGPPGVF